MYGKGSKKIELHKKEEVDEILENIKGGEYIVTDVKKRREEKNSSSTIYDEYYATRGFKKVRVYTKKTMSVAQGLYEGVKIPEKGSVGLITYMRTDSTRISEEARAAAKEQISKTYGNEYYENRYYKRVVRHKMLTKVYVQHIFI